MDMDAYIGAGILLDLINSTQPLKQQQQQKATPKPKPKQQQKERQQQQMREQQMMDKQRREHLQRQQQAQALQQQQQQQQQVLPSVQTRPRTPIVLDLSGSPKLSDTPAAQDTTTPTAAPVASGFSGSPPSNSHTHTQQQQVLHLGCPSGSSLRLSSSPTAAHSAHQLPPRPPRMTQQQQQHHTYHIHALQQQQQQYNMRQMAQQGQTPPQPHHHQQQQQQADLNAEHIQAALQVATQLGKALGSDSEAFGRVMSFVNQNSDKPAALYQFMASTLAQITGEKVPGQAAAAAAAAAAGKAAAKELPRGLIL
jgi:hypothetical protein